MKTIRLKIKVTKEVIAISRFCQGPTTSSNCAIARSVRRLFPDFQVTYDDVYLGLNEHVCLLPEIARNFIINFDKLRDTPDERLKLNPIEFEVDIPEKYFPEISEVHKILANCQTMELV